MKKELTKDDILIMVLFLGVGNKSIYETAKIINDIQKQLNKSKEPFEKWYIIPIKGESKIECLNPKLLSKNEYQKVKKQFDKSQNKINEILKDIEKHTIKLEKPTPPPTQTIKEGQNPQYYKCKICRNPGCYGECLIRRESEK